MKKNVIMTSIVSSLLAPTLAVAKVNEPNETVIFDPSIKIKTPKASALKNVIEKAFKSLTSLNATDKDIARLHSGDYLQYTDGKTLNYEDFVNHVKALQRDIKSLKIVIHDMIFDGNKVVTRHTAYGVKKDEKEIEVQVIAVIEIKDNKFIVCHELSHLIKGEETDRDIGSRD